MAHTFAVRKMEPYGTISTSYVVCVKSPLHEKAAFLANNSRATGLVHGFKEFAGRVAIVVDDRGSGKGRQPIAYPYVKAQLMQWRELNKHFRCLSKVAPISHFAPFTVTFVFMQPAAGQAFDGMLVMVGYVAFTVNQSTREVHICRIYISEPVRDWYYMAAFIECVYNAAQKDFECKRMTISKNSADFGEHYFSRLGFTLDPERDNEWVTPLDLLK